MYYLFQNHRCIGAYSYEPDVDDAYEVISSDEHYQNLCELQTKDGKITIVPLPPAPPQPPEMIEEENYSPETIELFNAIAGIYELIEKGEKK